VITFKPALTHWTIIGNAKNVPKVFFERFENLKATFGTVLTGYCQ
jgi:hypothetical protein